MSPMSLSRSPTAAATVERRDYCDGFGRILQSRDARRRARDGRPGVRRRGPVAGSIADRSGRPSPRRRPRSVSGSTAGRPTTTRAASCERFEPAFGTGWAFEAPDDRAVADALLLRRDGIRRPDGRARRRGARTVRGVPGTIASPDLSDPTTFEPTPWEAYVYDANDNLARTHPLDPHAGPGSNRTSTRPASALRDALGRTIASVRAFERACPTAPSRRSRRCARRSTTTWRVTSSRRATPLGRVGGPERPCARWDAASGGAARWRSSHVRPRRDGHSSRRATAAAPSSCDRTTRCGGRSRRWARDESTADITLRERLDYGDAGTDAQTAAERQSQSAT